MEPKVSMLNEERMVMDVGRYSVILLWHEKSVAILRDDSKGGYDLREFDEYKKLEHACKEFASIVNELKGGVEL